VHVADSACPSRNPVSVEPLLNAGMKSEQVCMTLIFCISSLTHTCIVNHSPKSEEVDLDLL